LDRLVGLGGEFVKDGPETADEFDGFGEIAEVDGFDDVGVDAESVGLIEIRLGAGRGHHDDRDALEAVVRFHTFEKFQAGHAGHFIVKKDDDGAIGFRAFVNGGVKKFKSFNAIVGNNDGIDEIAGFESGGGEMDIVDIVLDEQDWSECVSHLN
jgi:hypothetical protein